MVKKLFKHEFKAWFRVMAVVYAVMLAVAGAHRLFQCFETDSSAYIVISVLGIVIFFMVLVVCIAFCEIFGVVRFYKNLFTGEGYLSLTLPVSAASHLWVKALTAGAMLLLTMLVAALSVLIVTAGDVFTEVCKAASYLLEKIPENASGHIIGYCVELVILLLLNSVTAPMLYYTCICIGQLFRKHRILGAIGVYFGYYYLCQILGTAMTGALTAIGELSVEETTAITTEQTLQALHGVFCTGILWAVLTGVVYFVICHYIISRKLNLE